MLKAAVVLDSWKLPIFKKMLDKENYIYSEHDGPGHWCITLSIETDDLGKLALLVSKMNSEAVRFKNHKGSVH